MSFLLFKPLFCFVSISHFNLLRIAKRIIEITQRGGKAQRRAVQDRAHSNWFGFFFSSKVQLLQGTQQCSLLGLPAGVAVRLVAYPVLCWELVLPSCDPNCPSTSCAVPLGYARKGGKHIDRVTGKNVRLFAFLSSSKKLPFFFPVFESIDGGTKLMSRIAEVLLQAACVLIMLLLIYWFYIYCCSVQIPAGKVLWESPLVYLPCVNSVTGWVWTVSGLNVCSYWWKPDQMNKS